MKHTQLHRNAVGGAVQHLVNVPRPFMARHAFFRDVAILAGGSVAAQALPILFTPVLTRLYTPSDIGALGLFTSFINFSTGAITLGYSFAIVSAKNDREASLLTALSALVVVPMALVETLMLFMLIRTEALGLDQLPYWSVAAMVPALFLTGIYTALRYWMIRFDDYGGISRATIAQSVGRMFVQVIAGLFGAGDAGLIGGEVAGRSAGLRQMYRSSRGGLLDLLKGSGPLDLHDAARAYRKFPLLSAPSMMLNGVAFALPVPLVATFFGIAPAGQYAIATRIMILPLSLAGTSFSDVFHRHIAEISQNAPDRALGFLFRSFIMLFGMALIPAVIVTVGGEELFAFVLGPEWAVAGAIATAVVPWVLMQTSVSPLARVAQVYQGQESQLAYNVLHIANIVGVMWFGSSRGWSLVTICTVLSWAQAAIYLVYFFLLVLVIRKYKMINVPKEEVAEPIQQHRSGI